MGKKPKRKYSILVGLFLAAFLTGVFITIAVVWATSSSESKNRIKVFVSIPPQAYFVERVGGDRVDVSVMVGPGHSPATYEPRPKQMSELGGARLYFRTGVPFENVWMRRLAKVNPKMRVIDTHRGIELISVKSHGHGKRGTHAHLGIGLKDPHIWTSLRLVKIQAQNICDALVSEDIARRSYYKRNLAGLHRDLDNLDARIAKMFKDLKTRKFMVFHPAWGYFARDYALEEIPIEMEAKEPSAKALADLIEQAKQHRTRVVFVQQQFSKASAEAVARAIGAKVVQVDPLARDYLNNMRKVAETFARVMR